MKKSIEKHITIWALTKESKVIMTMTRDHFEANQSTNITPQTKIGDSVYWYDTSMYMNKWEGVVVAIETKDWDYNKPLGERGINHTICGDIKKYWQLWNDQKYHSKTINKQILVSR